MINRRFDTIIGRATGMASRRASLRLLGGAALASAFAAPAVARAGKTGKTSRNRCKQQRGQCFAFVAEFCEPKGDPQSCAALYAPCCALFAQCSARAGLECFALTNQA